MKSQNMKMCILSALFAAFTAILSQIAFPVPFITGNIPFSLGLLAVLITSGVLGGVWGTASIAVYIALGCVGVPVFANFRAAEALVGATGGYIVGYLFCALVVGFVTDRRKGASYVANVLAMVVGTAVCYAFGTIWYSIYAGIPFAAALSAAVVPFIPLDLVKIFASAYLVKKLRRLTSKHLVHAVI